MDARSHEENGTDEPKTVVPAQGVQASLWITLPAPPSANRMWMPVANPLRIIRTPLYRAWKEAAGWDVTAQRGGKQAVGPVVVELSVARNAFRDIDNYLKACLDALQHGRAIANDKQVDGVHLGWSDLTKAGHVDLHLLWRA